MRRKIRRNWIVPEGAELTDLDRKVLAFQEEGCLVPSRKLIKTPEQIEGIRRSGGVNTGVLDLVAQEIHAGMTTLEIDEMVYDYTVSHGAIPAPLNYEGFPKSVCTSINNEVCHGIPSSNIVLADGDIVNVDCSTILNGYFSDSSRMFCLGNVAPEHKKLVDVAKECGVDAVKFQTFKAKNLISRYAPKAEYQKETTGENDSQLEMTAKLELSYNDFIELKNMQKV